MITTATKDLLARLTHLARDERHSMADFLVTLAEFDARRCWIELGYANLFDFLHRELGMSRGTAFYRKTAAELIQRYPEVAEPLRDGRSCITAVHALSRAIKPENRAEILPRFFHLSKQDARAVAAELAPAEFVARKELVTTVSAPLALAPSPSASPAEDCRAATNETFSQNSQPVEPICPERITASALPTPARASSSQPSSARPIAQPLTATETRYHLTVSRDFLAKLDRAKLALSHSLPSASAEAVLSAGLDLLLARDARKKGLVARPRAARTAPATTPQATGDARKIPAEVRRAVWKRDGGCCQWTLAGGGVCGSRYRCELDHVTPVAHGGESTIANCRVLCRRHNVLAARQAFGDTCMDRWAGSMRTRTYRDPSPAPARRAVVGSGPPSVGGLS